MQSPDYKYEQYLWDKDKVPAGVDEAGRGPLAGPVVAAAVIIDQNNRLEGLNDSKKLTENKRAELFDTIKEKSLSYAIGIVDPETIDKINILQAALRAMEIAVNNLKITPSYLLIDGNKKTSLLIPQEAIVKGDSKSMSIAAASIIAKVTRDNLMKEYDEIYPQYEFSRHKGYGTEVHRERLREYGPCDLHRRSFAPVRLAG